MIPHHATVAEIGRGLRAHEYSSVEITRHFLGRIDHANASLNAFVTVTPERAMADAKRADRMIARGEGGPLTGVPLVFMSHGGTSLMIYLIAVGIVLQVSKFSKK